MSTVLGSRKEIKGAGVRRSRARWAQFPLVLLLLCGAFLAWTRTVSNETKGSGMLAPSLDLNADQARQVKLALDYLDGTGYLKEANHLRRMLAKGEIVIDPSFFSPDKNSRDAYGRTSNCYFWFQEHKIRLSVVLFAGDEDSYLTMMQFRVFLASVLLHEEVHTNQSDFVGGIEKKEQEAYRKQLQFLRDQVDAATPRLANILSIREEMIKLDLSSFVPNGDVKAFCAKVGIR